MDRIEIWTGIFAMAALISPVIIAAEVVVGLGWLVWRMVG